MPSAVAWGLVSGVALGQQPCLGPESLLVVLGDICLGDGGP